MTGKKGVVGWKTVAIFMATFPDGDRDRACDVRAQVGWSSLDGGRWYVRTRDDAGGSDGGSDEAFSSEEVAIRAAEALAEGADEGGGAEAEDWLRSRDEAERDEATNPDGPWACYWSTALDDAGTRSRYTTRGGAEAAASLAQAELEARYPGGTLLCGFEVRRLERGRWIAPETGEG